MNSSRNNPFSQLSENSEPTIKRDLRVRGWLASMPCGGPMAVLIDERPVSELVERLGSYPMHDKTSDEIFNDFRAGMRSVLIGRDAEMTYTLVDPGKEPDPVVSFDWPLEGSQSVTRTYQLEGLVNHPKSRCAGAGGGRRGMLTFALAMAALGRTMNDVIVIGGSGSRPLKEFDYAVFDDCHMVPHDVDLSQHPGERHRQLSRKLTSPRSRAGKAARWSS